MAEPPAALVEALGLPLFPLPPLLLLPPPPPPPLLVIPLAFADSGGGLLELALNFALVGEDALPPPAARADLLLLACTVGCLLLLPLGPADWCVAVEGDGRELTDSLGALEAGAAEDELLTDLVSCTVGYYKIYIYIYITTRKEKKKSRKQRKGGKGSNTYT